MGATFRRFDKFRQDGLPTFVRRSLDAVHTKRDVYGNSVPLHEVVTAIYWMKVVSAAGIGFAIAAVLL